MRSHAKARSGRLILSMLALAGWIGAADAVELDPAAVVYKLPDQIQWIDPLGSSGVKQAVLVGDPTKSGLYVVLVKWLPHNMSRPHWHPNDRYIRVLSGTWWVGSGNKFDPESTVPMPPGTF